MKHLKAMSRVPEKPGFAQSALEIKVEFKLDVLDLATGKFPRTPPDDTGGAGA